VGAASIGNRVSRVNGIAQLPRHSMMNGFLPSEQYLSLGCRLSKHTAVLMMAISFAFAAVLRFWIWVGLQIF
jgi:hypothetical protein